MEGRRHRPRRESSRAKSGFAPRRHRLSLQVIASAGLRSATAETDHFEVIRKPRTAYITAPEQGAQFEYGQGVVLAGGGNLGLGYRVPVHGLPPPDGQHGQATETREIVITERRR